MAIRRIYMRSTCNLQAVVQGDPNMKNLAIPFAALLAVSAAPARAQVGVRIELGLPVTPRLVVVEPGIQVVEGFHEEVFFHNGWYWCRRPDGWYRARTPRARFEWIEGRRVPGGLMRMPAGHYRNYRHEEHREMRHEEHRHDDHHHDDHRDDHHDDHHRDDHERR